MAFTVQDRGPGQSPPQRFDGDFDITLSADASARESDLRRKITVALEAIDAGLREDANARPRPALASARRQWWLDTARKMRAAADGYAAGQADLNATDKRLSDIEAERVAATPCLKVTETSEATRRFVGDFSVDANCQLDPDELYFVDRVNAALRFSAEEAARSKTLSDATRAAIDRLRDILIEGLKTNLGYFNTGTNPRDLANNVFFLRGNYDSLSRQLGGNLFSVRILYRGGEDGHEEVAASRCEDAADGADAVDLHIEVAKGLPPPNDVVSPEKQDLYVQIDNALTVISTVCEQLRDQASRPYRIDAIAAADRRARRLLDEYVRKLAGIAGLGLEGPHTALAKLALISLKAEFSAREAGRIKNNYVRKLGLSAALFAAFFLAAYLLIRLTPCVDAPDAPPPDHAFACLPAWWDIHKTFLLAAAGASIGTWLSFAVRRLDLPFEDLALLDEHSLDPPFRILFVVALTLLACLLFWTGAINISIGGLNTAPDNFKATGSIAVVVGLFCGLSERALAAAMSNRAAAFVGGLASGR